MKDKTFDNIDVNSKIVQYSYIASYWLKRKPLQIKENISKEPVFINERFINEFLLLALNSDLENTKIYNPKQAAVIPQKLLDYLKYESVNPKNLELFLLALNTVK